MDVEPIYLFYYKTTNLLNIHTYILVQGTMCYSIGTTTVFPRVQVKYFNF